MNESIIEERKNICRKCPIFSPSNGKCNPSLWLDPETNQVSTHPKSGYIRGCGCTLAFKWPNAHNHCNAGKW